jgi:hypothetical protein
MGRTKKTDEAADTPEKVTAAKPASPRYKYIGPNVARMNFPAKRFAFRPALLTDNQIIGILDRYPDMIRYFEDAQAVPE